MICSDEGSKIVSIFSFFINSDMLCFFSCANVLSFGKKASAKCPNFKCIFKFRAIGFTVGSSFNKNRNNGKLENKQNIHGH